MQDSKILKFEKKVKVEKDDREGKEIKDYDGIKEDKNTDPDGIVEEEKEKEIEIETKDGEKNRNLNVSKNENEIDKERRKERKRDREESVHSVRDSTVESSRRPDTAYRSNDRSFAIPYRSNKRKYLLKFS